MEKTTCKELTNFYLFLHFDVVIEYKLLNWIMLNQTQLIVNIGTHEKCITVDV